MMDDKQWVMTASNNKYSPSKRNGGVNLPGGHAYTLLGAAKLSNGTKLLKLRNPWGKEDYEGPWSDVSSEMTDSVRQELSHEKNTKDGVFYVDMATFKTYFSEVQVAFFQDWQTSLLSESSNRATDSAKRSWNVQNTATQNVSITLDMHNDRLFPNGCNSAEKRDLWFFALYSSSGTVSPKYGNYYSYTN